MLLNQQMFRMMYDPTYKANDRIIVQMPNAAPDNNDGTNNPLETAANTID